MKKLLLLLSCIFLATPKIFATCDTLYLYMDVKYVDPTGPQNKPHQPVMPPSVSIDGHTLYLYSGCAGATLQVVNTLGVAVYTEELYETTTEVELPETLVGEYELQILRGNFCFYATIEL